MENAFFPLIRMMLIPASLNPVAMAAIVSFRILLLPAEALKRKGASLETPLFEKQVIQFQFYSASLLTSFCSFVSKEDSFLL